MTGTRRIEFYRGGVSCIPKPRGSIVNMLWRVKCGKCGCHEHAYEYARRQDCSILQCEDCGFAVCWDGHLMDMAAAGALVRYEIGLDMDVKPAQPQPRDCAKKIIPTLAPRKRRKTP